MDLELAKTIGRAARAARSTLGLSQADAAEKIGVSTEFYARIERGQTLPSVPTLVRMAEELKVSADALLGREGAPKPRVPVKAAATKSTEELSPELRRLVRRLRRARPGTVRLLSQVASAIERPSR